MRTTVTFAAATLKQAKKRANEEDSTLSELVERALRKYLTEPRAEKTKYRFEPPLLTGTVANVDVADRDALYELMDGAELGPVPKRRAKK
jgi:hypothetical protein